MFLELDDDEIAFAIHARMSMNLPWAAGTCLPRKHEVGSDYGQIGDEKILELGLGFDGGYVEAFKFFRDTPEANFSRHEPSRLTPY